MELRMDEGKRLGRIVGWLFIATTAVGIVCAVFLSLLSEENYFMELVNNYNDVLIGGVLFILMAFGCASIALWMYPIISKKDGALALASVVFRIIEGVLFLTAAGILLGIAKYTQTYSGLASGEQMVMKQIVDALLSGYSILSRVIGSTAFCIGAIFYNVIFYKHNLVPKWLALWGGGAALLHMGSAVLSLLMVDAPMPLLIVINLPIAIGEMVLAVWLIVKGFNVE